MNRWRKVEYTDDGCERFQCLNCKDTWESRTPASCWSYCPNCGTRWLGEHECRPASCPRWFFDRYGDNPDWNLTAQLTYGVEPVRDIRFRGCWRPATHKWLFEGRYKWNRDAWSKWEVESSFNKERMTEAKWALGVLQRMRADGNDDTFIKRQYRVRLVKIK